MSWWKNAVFYHIYPRSFMDTTGNGIGDLRGIRTRLDYLSWLGVDALWLSPVYPSPMVDFGYDISDHCDIDPLFGDLGDFDDLLSEAHRLNIRIVMDIILHNTSYEHPWFQESKSSRTNPKADWYIWRDANDGNTPNNWLNFFSGQQGDSAWTWEESRRQYYLHAFSEKQCDLNLRHPEVQAELEKILRFWLDRGVDGFRLDSVCTLLKDPKFRDFPQRSFAFEASGFSALSRYFVDNVLERPENLLAVERIREILDEYPGERIAIGESASEKGLISYLDYSSEGRLHFAFNFSFLNALDGGGARSLGVVKECEALFDSRAWPCYVMGHHDTSRLLSRISREDRTDDFENALLYATYLLTLRGTPFLYYGDEIGMADTEIPFDRILDPFGKAVWPAPGRDSARSPMQWNPGGYGGFSEAEPWLPVSHENLPHVNVEVQRQDSSSPLLYYHKLIHLRKERPSLRSGAFEVLFSDESVVSYSRRMAGEESIVILNFGGERVEYSLPVDVRVLLGTHRTIGDILSGSIVLSPQEAVILEP